MMMMMIMMMTLMMMMMMTMMMMMILNAGVFIKDKFAKLQLQKKILTVYVTSLLIILYCLYPDKKYLLVELLIIYKRVSEDVIAN